MTIIDRGCWERGCACYDSRIADETVEVVEKRPWVGLTAEDLKLLSAEWRIVYGAWMDDFARDIEAKLKEKNT
jgi:hypothetical protein